MGHDSQHLIVGAGPVGLAAALFLSRQGLLPRIVEMRTEPSLYSKALAVNPRTLEILEPTGLTSRMLELGLPIGGVQFYRGSNKAANLSLRSIHPDYPFMLALSQATTEQLLAEALAASGVNVERGVKMVECRTLADRVEVALEASAGGLREIVTCSWLLAADGAQSTAREKLGIVFGGSTFPGEWYLADAPLKTALAENHVHIFFLEGRTFLFMIRVVDQAVKTRPGEAVWRVLGNHPEPLSYLTMSEQTGPPIWTSSFHVSHRIVRNMAAGGIYFAGDAAHIHSPMGARGMNLGLEDAWVFTELARMGRLAEYDRLRHQVDGKVVRQVELLSRVVSAQTSFYWFIRTVLFPMAIRVPFIHDRMLQTVTGLDHQMPQVITEARTE